MTDKPRKAEFWWASIHGSDPEPVEKATHDGRSCVYTLAVTPAVLAWARDERRLSKEAAATRIGISVAELDDLETGNAVPNLTMLRKMAQAYQIAFASLLMPTPLPPSTRPRVDDFRTHGGHGPHWSPDLALAVDEIEEVIETLVDLRDSAPELFADAKLPAALRADDTPGDIPRLAMNQRKRLGLTVDAQLGWDTERQAFNHWRAAIETQGVFTYILPLGDPGDCRGLSILDNRRIPALVVNSEEIDPAARTFTLLHEYAHLLIRQTGISDQNPINATERVCNQLAAYILMPPDEFRVVANGMRTSNYPATWNDAVIAKISKAFKVSRTAVVLHLEDVRLAPSGLYQTKMRDWFMLGKKARRGGGIIPYAGKVTNRLGIRHVRVVLDALDRGRINKLDAHELLNVRPEHFGKLRDEISDRQARYGGSGA